MKKLFLVILTIATLASCSGKNATPAASPAPVPSPSNGESQNIAAISSTTDNPIGGSWTVLGEVGLLFGDDYYDIYLATEAERDENGEMMWDDSQKWALVAVGEKNNYVLFDEDIHGQAYMEVDVIDDIPTITLIRTSSLGLSVTRYHYVFENSHFITDTVITPIDSANNIYTSFPEYK
ncbi:MAG: hypothetical protein Q4B31_02120 [Clostridia bacterium]|nr:hypothetical protein [Clostridia bacterium]